MSHRELPTQIIEIIKRLARNDLEKNCYSQLTLDTILFFSQQRTFDEITYRLLLSEAFKTLVCGGLPSSQEFAIIETVASYFAQQVLEEQKEPQKIIPFPPSLQDILGALRRQN